MRLPHDPLIGADEKTCRAASRVVNGKVNHGLPASGRRFREEEFGESAPNDRPDGLSRREVLPRAFLLSSVFLEETLVGLAFQVHVQGSPFSLVNQGDQLLEIDRFAELGERAGKNVAQDACFLGQGSEDFPIVLQQVGAGALAQAGPAARLGYGETLLVGQLQEQQVGELLDIVAVVDTVVSKGVAKTPKFLDNVGVHAAIASLIW